MRAEGSRDRAHGIPLRSWGDAPLVLAEDVRGASVRLGLQMPPGLCCGPWSQRCLLSQARGWDTGRAGHVPGSPFVPASPCSVESEESRGLLFTGAASFGMWESSLCPTPCGRAVHPPVLLAAFQSLAPLSQARLGHLVLCCHTRALGSPCVPGMWPRQSLCARHALPTVLCFPQRAVGVWGLLDVTRVL